MHAYIIDITVIRKNFILNKSAKVEDDYQKISSRNGPEPTLVDKIFVVGTHKTPLEKLFGADVNYLETVQNSSNYQEVDALLNPSRHETCHDNFYWNLLKKLKYKPKYGYIYPTRVVVGFFCTLILMYDALSFVGWSQVPDFVDFLNNSTAFSNVWVQKQQIAIQNGIISNDSWLATKDLGEYIVDTITIAYISFIISLVFAVVTCFCGIFIHFTEFRFHTRRIRRGFRADIPTDKISSFTCISAGMKYGAYICAYPIWGMLIQFGLLFLILFLCIEIFILPIKIVGKDAWLVGYLESSWPGWMYTILVVVAQMLLTRYVFSIDRTVVKLAKKYDRGDQAGSIMITNRLLYDCLSLFFWFNYIFIGGFSLLMRVIYTVCMSLLYIGRLDQPAVQRNWETLDAGYAVYLGYQGFLEGNTHPLMLTSLQFFLAGPAGTKYRNRITYGESVVTDSEKLMSDKKFKARWRWYLAYTMVKNPSLILIRQERLKKLAESENQPEVSVEKP